MKKWISMILLVVMIICTSGCSGEETATVGFAWEIQDGYAYLTGIGNVTEGDILIPGEVNLKEKNGVVREAKLSCFGELYPVVVVSDAFFDCDLLTTVTFADGVQIENNQMHGPKNGMFEKCDNLVGVYNLPDSVVSMKGTFAKCGVLSEISNFPSSVTELSECFMKCTSLKTVPEIPQSVTGMVSCFDGCQSLTEISGLPSSVKDLTYCFRNCVSLRTVEGLPAAVKTMDYCFMGCESLVESPVLPQGVESIVGCFMACNSMIDPPAIPDSVMKMYYCFSDCASLVSMPEIPQNITDLSSAFANCTSLENTTSLPEGVLNLSGCFLGCTALKTAPRIPESVKYMNDTFMDCTALESAPMLPKNLLRCSQCFRNCTAMMGSVTIQAGQIQYLFDIIYNCPSLERLVLDICPYSDYELPVNADDYLPAQIEILYGREHTKGEICEFCGYSVAYEYVDGVLVGYENASDAYVEWFLNFIDNEVPDVFKKYCNRITLTDNLDRYTDYEEFVGDPWLDGFAGGDEVYIKIRPSYSSVEYTIYHELGHCLDWGYIESSEATQMIIPWLSYTEEWIALHQAEGTAACRWYNQSMYWSYTEEAQRNETFAIAVGKYFTAPNALKARCPGMHAYMDNLFREVLEAEAAAKAEAENAA